MIDAPWLRFGDAAALLRAIDEIGSQTGLGALLAEGSRRAARASRRRLGSLRMPRQGSGVARIRAPHLQAMALGLAVNARGADHNRSGAYEADLSGSHDRLAGGAPHVVAAMESEDRAAIMDSMILCKFLRGVFVEPYDEWARLLQLVTGWDMTGDELRRDGGPDRARKTALQHSRRLDPADDWLPDRFLAESLELESGRTATLSPLGDFAK